MEVKRINAVRVIKTFPGYEPGDVLKLDNKVGLFKYAYNDSEDKEAFTAMFDDLATHHGDISKKVIVDNISTYFEDITSYDMRSREEIEARIAEYEHAIRAAKDGKSPMNEIGTDEAVTAWQNLIWECEWFLGRRA